MSDVPNLVEHDGVADRLAAYRRLTAEEVMRCLPDAEPRRWLYDLVADYPLRHGKGMRAALCLSACRAFGGSEADALPAATALELAHNAFLVHDDIQDDSGWRRGRPTLHSQEGMPLALNAGDALAVLSLDVLRADRTRLGPDLTARLVDEFCAALWRSLEGQAVELGVRRDGIVDLTPRDYLEIISRKTSWYTTITPLRIGALIGSRGGADLRPLTRFGVMLGAAFQITDDLLNLTGDPLAYGKEILGDLREGKRTLMLIHLLMVVDPAQRQVVIKLLLGPDADRAEQAEWLAALLESHGSIEFARQFALGIAEAAHEAFHQAFAAAARPDDADVIRHFISYSVTRAG